MTIGNVTDVNDFLSAINTCKGNVWLISIYGDKYNMKSLLTQYVALGKIIGDHSNELELFCDNKEDEGIMMKFLYEHPEVVA